MKRTLLAGVDIGTQGTKAAVYDSQGVLVHEAFRASDLRRPAPGVVEEDPETQLESACQALAECAGAAGNGSIEGVAVAGQMAGVIGLGKDGLARTPYDSWLDTRCEPDILRMRETAASLVLGKTGGSPGYNHGPKILWLKRTHPDVYREVRAFVQPAAYVAMRMCGLASDEAFIDRTYLHFSGFADSPAARWDPELCGLFGIDPAVLPRIVRSHDAVGKIGDEAARRCGLASGTPVVAGCGDTAASFLGCGATQPGVCVDVAGTASVFAGTVDAFSADPSGILSCAPSATPGLWHPYAYVGGGGMNLEWFRGQIAAGLRGSSPELSWDDLAGLALKVRPRADDPYFVPHLGGRVSPSEPSLRGAWVGLTWDHGAGHLYRAMLEAVAFEYATYLRRLNALYAAGHAREVRVTGGGEKSSLWNAIKADALELPIVQVLGAGGAHRGAALIAGHGVGVLPDLSKAAASWTTAGADTRPDAGTSAIVRGRLARYEAFVRALCAVRG